MPAVRCLRPSRLPMNHCQPSQNLAFMHPMKATRKTPHGMNDSREDTKPRRKWNTEEVSAEIVDAAFHLHRDLGPGLLESVYEVILTKQLEKRGLHVERQKNVAVTYDGLMFDLGFRADLLVENVVLVELKSLENLAPVHGKQVLTYLRLLNLSLGLLINFGAATFKEGIKRIVNHHNTFASSRLRVRE